MSSIMQVTQIVEHIAVFVLSLTLQIYTETRGKLHPDAGVYPVGYQQ